MRSLIMKIQINKQHLDKTKKQQVTVLGLSLKNPHNQTKRKKSYSDFTSSDNPFNAKNFNIRGVECSKVKFQNCFTKLLFCP